MVKLVALPLVAPSISVVAVNTLPTVPFIISEAVTLAIAMGCPAVSVTLPLRMMVSGCASMTVVRAVASVTTSSLRGGTP